MSSASQLQRVVQSGEGETNLSHLSLIDLYERYIRPLPPVDRLRLVAMTTQELAQAGTPQVDGPPRRITDLHGLGAEIWKGVDVEEYVNSLRNE